MPWAPESDYYIFKEESIKAKAPHVSGVYGLYNIKHYILIGETADIEQSLLHHLKGQGLRFRIHRPTGFIFEACPLATRAERARELIEEYRPVLQTCERSVLRSFLWRLNNDNPKYARVLELLSTTSRKMLRPDIWPSLKASTQRANEKLRSFYPTGDQLVAIALAVVLTMIVPGLLGLLAGRNIEARRVVTDLAALAMSAVNPSLEALGIARGPQPQQGPSSREGALRNGREVESVARETPKPAEPPQSAGGVENADAEPVDDKEVSTITRGAPSPEPQGTQKPERVKSRPTVPVKKWTVQVKSFPERALADASAESLTAKGYDAFIVEAQVRGSTWYRVHVGQFDNRREAEKLRKILDTDEGFAGAFLTPNKKPEAAWAQSNSGEAKSKIE